MAARKVIKVCYYKVGSKKFHSKAEAKKKLHRIKEKQKK